MTAKFKGKPVFITTYLYTGARNANTLLKTKQ